MSSHRESKPVAAATATGGRHKKSLTQNYILPIYGEKRTNTVGVPMRRDVESRDTSTRTPNSFARVSRSVKLSQIRGGTATLETPRKDFVDRTLAATGLSVGNVAGTEKNQPFGHSFYRSPTRDTKYRIALGNSVNNEKHKSFVEIVANKLNFVPGPKYVQHSDWRENIKGRAGKFLGAQRKTFTDDIMKFEKTKPAPNAFDNKEKLKKAEKIEGSYT